MTCCPTCKRPWLGELSIERWAPRGLTRALVSQSLAQARSTGSWDSEALLGLFYALYKETYSVEYTSNIKMDLRHIQLMQKVVGEQAASCIEAFFSKDMEWVKAKALPFLSDPEKLTKWVIPVAVKQTKTQAVRPEWKPQAPVTSGVAFDPSRKRK